MLRAVSQLLWSDEEREEWFSLGENHEKAYRFGLHPLRNSLVETNHDLGIVVGMLAPGLDHGRCLFQRHNGGYRFVYRETMLLEHTNHFAEVFRQGVTRAQDIEFLLDEEFGFVGYRLLGVTDVDHAPGEGYLLDSTAESLRQPDGFDTNVRSSASREFEQPFVQGFLAGVDAV